MLKTTFLNYFLNIPVSINNLYGDPFIPKQIENTFEKLDKLRESEHQGIVSIITKTEINKEIGLRLKEYSKDLKLIVLVSISCLPYEIEKIKGNRFNTLKICNELKIPCLAYIRPFIPPFNTSEKSIKDIFDKIEETNTKVAVISGLRGNDEVLSNLNITNEEKNNWSMRVKIIPKEIRNYIQNEEKTHNILLFERTSCGVSYVLGLKKSYNPYYSSPQLAKCYNCPMKKTCFDKQNTEDFYPSDMDLELVKMLGYDAEKVIPETQQLCSVEPEKRTSCVSCCTSCFKLQRAGIRIKNKNLCLGDISLLRLLTKKLIFADGLIDNGDSDVARPNVLNGYNLYLLNSWWSYSRNISSCYGCSYCIVPIFKNDNCEYGGVPLEIAKNIIERKEIKW